MAIWAVVFIVLIIIKPFVLMAAITTIYRRVPMSDRGLAAVIAGAFALYFGLVPAVLFALLGVSAGFVLAWLAGSSALSFGVVYPLTRAMMPSWQHLLKNVPRAQRTP